MEIERLLKELAAETGLNALALDRNNCCALVFDDAMQIDLHYAEKDDVLHLCSVIGAIMASEKPALMRALLAANLCPEQIGEAHFAIDIARAEVLLCRTLAACDQRSGSLSDEMLKFVSACKTWRGTLSERRLTVHEKLS